MADLWPTNIYQIQMVYRKSISYFLCLLFLLILIDSMKTKVFQFKHYNFRKKQRLAKKYSPLEKDCEATKCQGHGGLELIKCTRKCISQLCYDELYAWDEIPCCCASVKVPVTDHRRHQNVLEEGEIDVRLTSFKGCVVKQLQDQESRTRGL